MPFKFIVGKILGNPFKRIILALIAAVIIFYLVLTVNQLDWWLKYSKGEREHKSDFVNEVDHWKELKNEAMDIISYLLGLWMKR